MAFIQLVPVEPKYVKLVTDRIEQFTADKTTKFNAILTDSEPDSTVMNDNDQLFIVGELVPIRALMKIYKTSDNITFTDSDPYQIIGRGWCTISPDH